MFKLTVTNYTALSIADRRGVQLVAELARRKAEPLFVPNKRNPPDAMHGGILINAG